MKFPICGLISATSLIAAIKESYMNACESSLSALTGGGTPRMLDALMPDLGEAVLYWVSLAGS
jgi:hypothetical protein